MVTNAVDTLETLELLGSAQWGLITAAQAQEAGVSRSVLGRLTDRGTLQRVRHGVYALPSAPGGALQGVRAAWLATGSRPVGPKAIAVVSGQSAAVVHRLGDLVSAVYEFAAPERRQTTLNDVRYRMRDLDVTEIAWSDGLPVTTVTRTVADLATTGIDEDHLAAVVRDALAAGTAAGASTGALAGALERRATKFGFDDGRTYLFALLDMAGHTPEPANEVDLRNLSDAVARSLTPQMQETMARMVEQFARQAKLVAPISNADLSAQITKVLASQSSMMRAAVPGLSPEAVRQITANAVDALKAVADPPRGLNQPAHPAELTASSETQGNADE